MNRNEEVQRLSQANRMIAGAETALMDQMAYFDRQRADGHDCGLAERGLRAFALNLSALRQRRELIVLTIGQLDRGLI